MAVSIISRLMKGKLWSKLMRWVVLRGHFKTSRPVLSGRSLLGATTSCLLAKVYASSNSLDAPGSLSDADIQKITVEGEKYLINLMQTLRSILLQTSVEYQGYLIKQIELTERNTRIGPVGEHWDELTEFRVRTNELKEELHKYEALACNLADMVSMQTFPDLDLHMASEPLACEINKLKKLCRQQMQEVNRYETMLLNVNRESILNSPILS